MCIKGVYMANVGITNYELNQQAYAKIEPMTKEVLNTNLEQLEE